MTTNPEAEDQRCYDCPDGSCDSKKAEWCDIRLKTQVNKLLEQVYFLNTEWGRERDRALHAVQEMMVYKKALELAQAKLVSGRSGAAFEALTVINDVLSGKQ